MILQKSKRYIYQVQVTEQLTIELRMILARADCPTMCASVSDTEVLELPPGPVDRNEPLKEPFDVDRIASE